MIFLLFAAKQLVFSVGMLTYASGIQQMDIQSLRTTPSKIVRTSLPFFFSQETENPDKCEDLVLHN